MLKESRDKALPDGFEREFSSLGQVLGDAADPRKAAIDSEQAALLFHDIHRQRQKSSDTTKNAVENRTSLQKMLYSGPARRKDVEDMERARWIEVLTVLLRATQTPMGKMLVEKPQTARLLGAGHRATTLRSRARLARSFLAWLSINVDAAFPTKLEHMVDCLKVRASEPRTRGTLKNHAGVCHRDTAVPGALPRTPQPGSAGQTHEASSTHAHLLVECNGAAGRKGNRASVHVLLRVVDLVAELGHLAFR